MEIGSTEAYTKRITEVKKGLGQKNNKVAKNDYFIFDRYFDSKSLAESTMDVGAEMIGMVKSIQNSYAMIPPKILQRISQEVLNSR